MSARYEGFKLARNYKNHREIYNWRKDEAERPDTLYSARIQGSSKYKDQREERVQKLQERRTELEEEQIRLQKRREEEIKERAERKKDRDQRQLEEFYSRNTVDWKSTLEERRRRREDENKESIRRGKAVETQWKGKLMQLEHKTEKYNQRREKRSDFYAKAPIARSIKIPDSYTPASSYSSLRIPSSSSTSSVKSYEPQRSVRSFEPVTSGDYSSRKLPSERTHSDDTTQSSYIRREERQTRDKRNESQSSDSESDKEREREKEREKEKERKREKERDQPDRLERDYNDESQENKENYDPKPQLTVTPNQVGKRFSDDDDHDHDDHDHQENHTPKSSHSSPEKSPREVITSSVPSHHHKMEPDPDPEPKKDPEPDPEPDPEMEELEREILAEQAAAAAAALKTPDSPPSSNDELDIKSFEFVDDPTKEADNPPQN